MKRKAQKFKNAEKQTGSIGSKWRWRSGLLIVSALLAPIEEIP